MPGLEQDSQMMNAQKQEIMRIPWLVGLVLMAMHKETQEVTSSLGYLINCNSEQQQHSLPTRMDMTHGFILP